MYRSRGQPMPHRATPVDITTINYTLSWKHLENPSNTTFVGPTQIDICRCPRIDLPKQDDHEPGHIYTRSKCVGPDVHVSRAHEDLWVLQAPHGPINMLRPATMLERERRKEVDADADPGTWTHKNFLLLSGPCPRGRYQSYACTSWLQSLSPAARSQVTHLTLLVQPYEEDCSDEATRQAFSEFTEYIVQHLPGFKTLYLNLWDDEMRLQDAASEFSILLHKENASIVVGCSWWKGETIEYTSVRAFLEAMKTVAPSGENRKLVRGERCGAIARDDTTEEVHSGNDEIEKDNEGQDSEAHSLSSHNPARAKEKDQIKTRETSALSEVLEASDQESSDSGWTNIEISPVSPPSGARSSWSVI